MAGRRFGPGDVVNRRVNGHLKELLPSSVSAQRDYHFEGQRPLPPGRIPGGGETCLCHLETYVGHDGCFTVYIERAFDRDTDREWTSTNRISRDESGGRSPFEYTVRTELELMGDTHVGRSRIEWGTLGSEPIHGGREAQAAVLLAEKMSHLRAREGGNPMDHYGSLASLGSLSDAIRTGRQIDADWSDVDALLGPDAETIAATTGFDELVSDRKRRRAERRGIDFLSEEFPEALDEHGGSLDSGDHGRERDGASEPWQTVPAEMSTAEAEAKLQSARQRIREMRDGFRPGSGDR